MVPDPGGSPAGGFDFVSCVQESSATPLLDVQSIKHHGKNSPATYFPGLQQVVKSGYWEPYTTTHAPDDCSSAAIEGEGWQGGWWRDSTEGRHVT